MTAERQTELNGRKIVFSEVTSFGELFEDAKPFKSPGRTLLDFPSWEAGTWSDRGRKSRFHIGSYLIVSGQTERQSLDVGIKPALAEWIKSGNMLYASNDTTHFEVIVWDDGRALVTLSHGVIIGSHYLAIIDASTIPAVVEVPY